MILDNLLGYKQQKTLNHAHINSTPKQSYELVPFRKNELKTPTICHLTLKLAASSLQFKEVKINTSNNKPENVNENACYCLPTSNII